MKFSLQDLILVPVLLVSMLFGRLEIMVSKQFSRLSLPISLEAMLVSRAW